MTWINFVSIQCSSSDKNLSLQNISQNNVTFPICFSFFKPKTSLFFKHTLKVIISVIAVAILLGFSIIFPPLYDKIVSSIFLIVTYVITDERLVLFMYQVKYLLSFTYAAAAAKLLQSCPTLCDLIDGSPPGSSVSRILQARILEWVAISFSNTCMHAKPLQSNFMSNFVAASCPQLSRFMSNSVRPYGQEPTRLLCPQDSPGKNTGVGCHFLLHHSYMHICNCVYGVSFLYL